ncbi:MAG: YkvA family protein [Candidatus Methanoperedens sp.]|nr:YkvA family protein [Candidatus Methanoperedens sp.]
MITIKPLKEEMQRLKTDTYALFLSYKDPRVPWYAKIIIAATVGYALSPIDLIPDFIPVLGQLDDLIIVPAGISLALKLMPKDVLDEYRKKAQSELNGSGQKNWVAAFIIVLIWLLAVYLFLRFVFRI